MMNLIDATPMRTGWGQVYQSGVLASQSWDQDGLIVSMAGNENLRWPTLWVDLPDNDQSVLRQEFLIAMVQAVLAYLKSGIDVLIHCNEGKYRSTYMDVAVHMAGLKIPMEQAFGRVKAAHPLAALREGTSRQLKALELQLKEVGEHVA